MRLVQILLVLIKKKVYAKVAQLLFPSHDAHLLLVEEILRKGPNRGNPGEVEFLKEYLFISGGGPNFLHYRLRPLLATTREEHTSAAAGQIQSSLFSNA